MKLNILISNIVNVEFWYFSDKYNIAKTYFYDSITRIRCYSETYFVDIITKPKIYHVPHIYLYH